MTEEQIHGCVMRILLCSFKKPSENLIFLPTTADSWKQTINVDYADLINQCLMEILMEISSGSNPFQHLTTNQNNECDSLNNFSISPTHTLSPSPSPGGGPITLLFNSNDTRPQHLALSYLMDSYSRVAIEERNHPKRSSVPPLSDVLSEIRAQLVQYTSLLLQGYIIPFDGNSPSILLGHLLQQTVPRGFINELVTRTHVQLETFKIIFDPILKGLFETMQNASIVGNEHRLPLQILNELTEIRCGSRPVCTLLTKQFNFLPETCTPASGRELSKTSYLSPFLSVSVFAEDEPKVPEKFFSGNTISDKSLIQTLQQELENTRLTLHKIFHDCLANVPSRDLMINYIVKLLKHNEKRTQLQMEERNLAGDGFMLNLLSVLQMLSNKVKLDKIDFKYLFHPKTVIDIKNDTRLRFTSQETNQWLESFGESSFFFVHSFKLKLLFNFRRSTQLV